MKSHYDVVVAGGGPAGLVAAVQAARAGASTLLVEKSGVLGGTTILNGVNFPGLFHAWGRQIIAGIGWDLVTRAVAEVGDALPDFSAWRGQPHYRLQIRVNRSAYAALADELVLGSGATLLLHTMLASVTPRPNGWELALCTKNGLETVSAHTLVDCTGDANAVDLAGVPLSRNRVLQPGTLVVRAAGYDFGRLDFPALEQAFLAAVDSGELRRSDLLEEEEPVTKFLRSRGENAVHVVGIDGSSSEGKTKAEVAARALILRLQRFLRRQPGLANFHYDFFATECGIRETYTIRGEVQISAQDYASGRFWDDAVCYSFYPIDVHRTNGHGIDIRPLAEGVVPTIPYRALLPRDTRNLIVAGRCASGDQEAHSAFRVQASSMAMGQAAGAAAALAARYRCELREVELRELRELLTAHGAIVPTPAIAAQAAG